MEQLLLFANASSVSTLFHFATNLGNIRGTLYTLKDNTNKLRVFASQLNDGELLRCDLTPAVVIDLGF